MSCSNWPERSHPRGDRHLHGLLPRDHGASGGQDQGTMPLVRSVDLALAGVSCPRGRGSRRRSRPSSGSPSCRHGRACARRQLPDPSFELCGRALGQIELVPQCPQALLLGASNRRSHAIPALPATSTSQPERSAITGAASSAARVRFAEITWARVSSSVRARSASRTKYSSSTIPRSRARSRIPPARYYRHSAG
jgi:hypothetical protein